jgi:hypothetical protein
MIACHRKHLEQRCIERGYSILDAMACVVSENGDELVVDTDHPAYPKAKKGLGDMVADTLSAVGITKERVSRAVGGDCGCSKRQKSLNEFGKKLGIGN